MHIHFAPPTLPPGYTYTPYYCEENIYLLADSLCRDSITNRFWEIDAVFVSNETKTVALWNQKLSHDPAYPVVWDYHCILVLRPRQNLITAPTWVFDYDSCLALPCHWSDYIEATFQSDSCTMVPERFRSQFRVVPASDFLDGFASDRSHMVRARLLDGNLEYTAAPPNYPCIVGKKALDRGVANNLMQTFVEMSNQADYQEAGTIGEVMNDVEFWAWGKEKALLSLDTNKLAHAGIKSED